MMTSASLALALLTLLTPSSAGRASEDFDRPQYICMNKGFPGGWLIDDPSTFTQASVDAILAAVGGQRGGANRKLCLSFNMWTLYMSPANETTMVRSMDALLGLALANDLPLSVSLDPTQWWQSRQALYNWWDPKAPGFDPANAYNVEWTSPSPSNATAISWRNWGSQFRMPSPHPNFASPAFREAAAASVGPLVARIASWYRALPADKKWLLAFVRATQELWTGTNYFYYPGGNSLIPQPAGGDPQGGPAGTSQLGYAAVCGGGAGGPGCSGAPGDVLSVAQLDAVVSSLAGFLAQGLLDAGLPRSRVMVHTGSFFGAPPACHPQPCAFNSPQAAIVPGAFPAWSLYGGGTDPSGDAGLHSALDGADGAPWGACEWLAFFDGGHPESAWAAALAATQGFRNNRVVVVQNFESVQHDAGALAALAAALATEPACLIDAPTALTAARDNATASLISVTWAAPRSIGGPVESQTLLVSTLALTLPSAALAVPDVALLQLPGDAAAAEVTLPAGFDASEVYVQVLARGCAGSQSVAADAVVVDTRALRSADGLAHMSHAAPPLYPAAAPPSPPALVGSWTAFPNALPTLQLAQVPLLGNGRLGVALDAHNDGRAKYPLIGAGQPNSVDLWINSNGLWSCTSCGSTDPDKTVPACCSTVALGGLSLRASASGPGAFPTFRATQALANGTLAASLGTAAGGALSVIVRMDPSRAIVVANFSWLPAAGDSPSLDVDVAVWTLGAGAVSGSWTTGMPAPWRTGCADATSLAPVSCSLPAPPLIFASRNASTVDAGVMPVVAALAAGARLGPGATFLGAAIQQATPAYPPTLPFETTLSVRLQAGAWAAAVVAEAEARGPALADPVPRALAAAAAALAEPAGAIPAAADAWWALLWAKSSISLPAWPEVEAAWYGAQYALACTSATTASDDIPAPGLYGVWVTVDGPNWHGDYTLDYNYAAPYYGAFASNRAEQAEAYWAPVLAWLPPARIKAQVQAEAAHVTCPAQAAFYDCHLAPWGLASIDPMTKYMAWNSGHAALLFANHFEYTRNATFARDVTYPLLDSINAWWLCYLNHTEGGAWNDINAFNPDYEHEGQQVPNPQIALALIARTAAVQLDIAQRLSLPTPPLLEDLLTHLAPFNLVRVNVSQPVGANASFVVLPNTRCNGDMATFYNVPDAAACEAHCLATPGCGLFSYCPPTSVNNVTGCSGQGGTPAPLTCWAYLLVRLPLCVSDGASLGWTSGWLNETLLSTEADVWVAFEGAGALASDWFSSYPSWPAEAWEPGSPFAGGRAGATREAAQVASVLYANFAGGRPVDLFEMAVRAGANASAAALGLAWTPEQVLAGLDAWLAGYNGPSMLPRAPGGGIENTGVSRAVCDMLLQSYAVPPAMRDELGDFLLELFPFLTPNASAPAAFSTLLARGGFLVSAASDGAVASPVRVTAAYTLAGAPAARCSLVAPWPGGAAGATAACGGGPPNPVATHALPDGRAAISFSAPLGVECEVRCDAPACAAR